MAKKTDKGIPENMNALPEEGNSEPIGSGDTSAEEMARSMMGLMGNDQQGSDAPVEPKVETLATSGGEETGPVAPIVEAVKVRPAVKYTESNLTTVENVKTYKKQEAVKKMATILDVTPTITVSVEKAISLDSLGKRIKMSTTANIIGADWTKDLPIIENIIARKVGDDPNRIATGQKVVRELTLNGTLPFVAKVLLNKAEFVKAVADVAHDPAALVDSGDRIDEASLKEALKGLLPADVYKAPILIYLVVGEVIEVFVTLTKTLTEVVAVEGDSFGTGADQYTLNLGYNHGGQPTNSYLRVKKIMNGWK